MIIGLGNAFFLQKSICAHRSGIRGREAAGPSAQQVGAVFRDAIALRKGALKTVSLHFLQAVCHAKCFKIGRTCHCFFAVTDLSRKEGRLVYAVVRADLRAADEYGNGAISLGIRRNIVCADVRIAVCASHRAVGQKFSVVEYLILVGSGKPQRKLLRAFQGIYKGERDIFFCKQLLAPDLLHKCSSHMKVHSKSSRRHSHAHSI